MAGVVYVNWYATGFRGDKLAAALAEVTPLAARYGATAWTVHRSRDDRYMFVQTLTFEDKADWERYWYGEDMQRMRATSSGWYQVPLAYVWHDVIVEGRGANGSGDGNGGEIPAAAEASTV
jgi:hypothetical protein